MRRYVLLLLLLPFILAVSCAGNGPNVISEGGGAADQDMLTVFGTLCSADEALELAKNSEAVVFERQGCTSGREIWDAFYGKAESGKPASVLCAHYYTLIKEQVSEELYEEEKDQYPKLFWYLVEYDGKEYSVKIRESSVEELDQQETFRYLLHFAGDAPSSYALYSSYDSYVLVDDPEATMEGIWEGLYSSQAGAGYRHCTVYTDYSGWKGD